MLAFGSTGQNNLCILRNQILNSWLCNFLGLSLGLLKNTGQQLFWHVIIVEKAKVDLALAHCVVSGILSRSFIEDFIGLFGNSCRLFGFLLLLLI